jgi:putative peptidoglycan lipid II flippase
VIEASSPPDSSAGLRERARALAMREFGVREASLVIAASFAFSAALGAIRQILLNALFGAGDDISAYYAAVRLPETLFTLIAGGALWTAMIPVLVEIRRRQGDEAERRLADIVVTAVLAVSLATVLLGQLLAPYFVRHLLVPGFDEPATELTIRLTRLLLVQPVVVAVASVAIALLNSRNRFLVPAIAIGLHNLGELAGIALSWRVSGVGVWGPAIGLILGALVQALILFGLLWSREWRPRLRWAPRDRGLRAVLVLLVPTSLSLGVGYLGGVFDASFASRAPEASALPAIVNAWLLVGLPVRVIGFAAGQAAFPRLAAAALESDGKAFRGLMRRVGGAALAISIPAALALVLLARPVVRLLFEHGAFEADAGDLTARLVVLYAAAMPAYALTEVLTRGLVAMRDTRTPLGTNVIQLVLRAAICLLALDRYGVAVVPIAYAASSAVEAAILFAVLRRKVTRAGAFGGIERPEAFGAADTGGSISR